MEGRDSLQLGRQDWEWKEVKPWCISDLVVLEYVNNNSSTVVRDVGLSELDWTTIYAMFYERVSKQPAVIFVILKWEVRLCANRPHHRRGPPLLQELLSQPQSLPKDSENPENTQFWKHSIVFIE